MGLNFVAIDFETANGQRDSACSVGAVKVVDGVIVDSFGSLIDPELPFAPINVNIHKVTPDAVVGKPTMKQLWPDLLAFLGDSLLVAHNAEFDIDVMTKSLARYGIEHAYKSACSMKISKVAYPGMKSYRMKELCKAFGLPYGHHQSEADAEACALLMIKMEEDMGSDAMQQAIMKSMKGKKEQKQATPDKEQRPVVSREEWEAISPEARAIILKIIGVYLEAGVPRDIIGFSQHKGRYIVNVYRYSIGQIYYTSRAMYMPLPNDVLRDFDGLVIDDAPKSYGGAERRAQIKGPDDIEILRNIMLCSCRKVMGYYESAKGNVEWMEEAMRYSPILPDDYK